MFFTLISDNQKDLLSNLQVCFAERCIGVIRMRVILSENPPIRDKQMLRYPGAISGNLSIYPAY